jgi:hypothetical protein
MVADIALKHSCSVQPMLSRGRGRRTTASNLLLINGYTCICHQRSVKFSDGSRETGLYQVMISRTQIAEFHVLIAGENLFIVPTEVLHRHYAARSVYVPAHRRTCSTGSLDWWQYKDAWCLLKQD